MTTALTLEKHDEFAVLTLNRPEKLNIVRYQDAAVFRETVAALNADRRIKCVILTGAGRAFSAGGDLKAMKEKAGALSEGGPIINDVYYRKGIHEIVRALGGIDVPWIAAVNGPAIGIGCDFACLADMRIASASAIFGVTFLKVGLIPGDGGAWLLSRVIGIGRASELFYTGKTIDAATAEQWGLVSKVVPDDRLMDEAFALAKSIVTQPVHALRLTKSLLRQSQSASYDMILEMSAGLQAICHDTEDHIEAATAILERRPPVFTGR